jgi:hypothetical protein
MVPVPLHTCDHETNVNINPLLCEQPSAKEKKNRKGSHVLGNKFSTSSLTRRSVKGLQGHVQRLDDFLLFSSSTYTLSESLCAVTVNVGVVADDCRTDKVEKGGQFLCDRVMSAEQSPTGQESANDLGKDRGILDAGLRRSQST